MKQVNEIKRICNLGCGTMGFGTAIDFARHGYDVNMFGRKDASIERAMGNILATLAIMKANGLLNDEDENALLNRIHGVTTIEEAARDADFVIESVAEDMAVKQQVYRELEGYLPADVILRPIHRDFRRRRYRRFWPIRNGLSLLILESPSSHALGGSRSR